MRSLAVGLLAFVSLSPASAEVWQSREGTCGEWRGRWNVEQQPDGVWTGYIDFVQVGGPCAEETGHRARSEVRAVIVGDSFFGSRRIGTEVCSYYGRLREDRARGATFCERNPHVVFALRFPPGPDRQARPGTPDPQDDEWLDDPQTLDRRRPPPGFDLPFEPGPLRP